MSTTDSIKTQETTPPIEATPRPWEYTGGDIWIDTRTQVCCGRGYQECCGEPDVEGGQELVAQTSEVNAAFIVKAVNAHDVLLKALNAVIDASSDYLPPDGISKDEFINRVLGATDNAEIVAALQACAR